MDDMSDFQEAWLAQLLGSRDEAARVEARAAVLRRAASEGLRLFRVAEDGESEAAARHFHEHGFAVLLEAVKGKALESLQRASAELIRCAVRASPGGNRGHQRYTLHRTTMVRDFLDMADNEAVCSVLEQIWDSPKFSVQCTGGDFSLPSAEKQGMHADIGSRHKIADYFAFQDPSHPDRSFCDLPAPVVKVYVAMADLDESTGPPLFVPGSHWRYTQQDVPEDDPPGSKRAFCPQGSAIIMDMRVWHRGTPNLSEVARPMLSIHYAGPWYNENILKRPSTYWQYHRGALTRSSLQQMRPRARELCKHLGPQQCEQCGCEAPDEGSPQRSGSYRGRWYCSRCWSEWESLDTCSKQRRVC